MQLNLFDELFEANGRQAVLFYYQEADTPVSGKSAVVKSIMIIVFVHVVGDMVRCGIVPSSSKSRMKRVIATDGTRDGFTGICIFFIRPRNVRAITSANIADELLCGQLDARGGLTLLEVVKEYMQLVMLPALQQGQNWGTLQQKQVDGFMSTFKTYINFLQSMFYSSNLFYFIFSFMLYN